MSSFAKEVIVATLRVKHGQGIFRIFLLTGMVALTLASGAGADWMGEFFPLRFGSTWTYENRAIPGDTYTESVFALIEYEGHWAMRFGIDALNHTIAHWDGRTVTVFAEVEDGVLFDLGENIVVGEFEDGHIFRQCLGEPCDSLLLRVWDNLDPVLRSIYQVDPVPGDLVLEVTYDREYTPNFHNAIVTSNLPGGITPPAGAVTNLTWYLRDVGAYGLMDIEAQSGGIGETFFLIDHSTAVKEPPAVPHQPALGRNCPNPFTGATAIRCQMPAAAPGSSSHPAGLRIYDETGRAVRLLEPPASSSGGSWTYVWDGRDQAGRRLPAGAYFYGLESAAATEARRMLLLR